ncbi:FAD-dependent 5-carboxymethylaminomethyl-2-thiouridine(34) oxidoreductase MnmC [Aquabacterium sp.]|uniref:FAD-dependent 5-carboxymethylaminomethyl-2-thiouridine(34) oxidoreductase MnmC n=1 Tax=Aquabacterium sp. TaxID=1872578 RepID=UPI002CB5968B|nr:FAD-dependent 5-carboxymethylaminomethyl-2-thiouridine(34) oxidoreductase MnmC [Aquabacterium sp.]HSW05794.1 FAD-dependent 5-carboxymethylaminomethyl-2-thiouridine(34) oxidoreductase MnmC [Aquabacterium sp.]
MNFGPLQPARIDFSEPGVPRSAAYDDVYHTQTGALGQARHVFLGGNGLPGRWAGRPSFVVLETGFGLGNNFLATWAAWRADGQRCDRLIYVAIEKHPPLRPDLARAHATSQLPDLADELLRSWPPLTPDIHVIDFEQGRLRLLLVLADVAAALPELVASVDAFYLDGFAPSRNPEMWDRYRLRSLARLAAPGATVATWSVARELREGLSSAGFEVGKAQGFSGKRDMTVGRFAPRFVAPAPPGRRAMKAPRVAVVGAGLAGAGVARALAASGVAVEVLEGRADAALATSGNAGGLFHGIVHGHDGPHARWLRAAALLAQRLIAPAIRAGELPGHIGLLRGESSLAREAMQSLLDAQALPPDWVQALSADTASAQAGLPWRGPAWFYPGGGWVAPAALVRQWLHAERIRLRANRPVAHLQRGDAAWLLLDAAGRTITDADAVVLANGADAMRLLGQPPWPWQALRGQVSLLAGDVPRLPLPLADKGYALQLPDGRVLCGATSQADDDGAESRDADHAANLATLQRLTGWSAANHAITLEGRVGWRMQTADRLPLLGPVPLPGGAAPTRADQPRFIERLPGLYVASGFGSRGITHAALAGEVLAAWITGAPMPVPASLLDAVDPARFAARSAARLNRKPGS